MSKVILSRKGFDSTFGGYPSPIFPKNTELSNKLLSIPIPYIEGHHISSKLYNGTKYHPKKYSDLNIPQKISKYLNEIGIKIETYQDLILQLRAPKDTIRVKEIDKKNKLKSIKSEGIKCHLDPDLLYESIANRHKDWRPVFGQSGRVQRHLMKNRVKKDDIFLFFGWFKRTRIKDNKLIYDKEDKKGKQVIFGYFQIGDIITKVKEIEKYPWLTEHPHLDQDLWRNYDPNTIYIARERLTINENFLGAGVLNFCDDLILTETNQNRNPKLNKSFWKLSLISKDTEISLKRSDAWNNPNYFYSIGLGQEMVISDKKTIDILLELLENLS